MGRPTGAVGLGASNKPRVIPESPCDDCGLRTFCVKGSDCKGFRMFTDGAPLRRALTARGHNLGPINSRSIPDAS